jgi:hypothetical protein
LSLAFLSLWNRRPNFYHTIGSRGITIFNAESGAIVYTSGNAIETVVTKYGHYPELRSDSKGSEPETVLYKEFGNMKLLFVCTERANVILVYDVSDIENPILVQVLPAGVSPEGIYAIPQRNLLVASAEADDREARIRAHISIYELKPTVGAPAYPTMVSSEMESGLPIPFSALSGLAANGTTLFSVADSAYKSSRMYVIDTTTFPYVVTDAINIVDTDDVLLDATQALETSLPGLSESLINADKTVNLVSSVPRRCDLVPTPCTTRT